MRKEKIKKTYRTWLGLRQRCNNPKNQEYKNYGGRGIKVCKEWDSFQVFESDMGNVDSEESRHLTIERIDVNGDYCKDNCKWATQTEQANNRRNTKKVLVNGKYYTYREIMDITGFTYSCILERAQKGDLDILSLSNKNFRIIDFNGESKSIKDWAVILNVKYPALHKNLMRNKYDANKSIHFKKYMNQTGATESKVQNNFLEK